MLVKHFVVQTSVSLCLSKRTHVVVVDDDDDDAVDGVVVDGVIVDVVMVDSVVVDGVIVDGVVDMSPCRAALKATNLV